MDIRKKCLSMILFIVTLILCVLLKCNIACAKTEINIDIDETTSVSDDWNITIQDMLIGEFLFVVTGLSLIILMKILKVEVSKKLKIATIILEIIATLIATLEIFIPTWSVGTIFFIFDFIKIILYGIVIFMILKIIKNAISTNRKNVEKIILYIILILLVVISIIIIIYFWNFYLYCGALINCIICLIVYAIDIITGVTIAIKSLIKRKE